MDELTLQEQAALWLRIKQLQAKAEELRESSEAVSNGIFRLQGLGHFPILHPLISSSPRP